MRQLALIAGRIAVRGCSAVSAVAFVLVALASPGALADAVAPADATGAQKQEAMDRFVAGKKAAGRKDFEKAIEEFRASLDVIDSPNARLELSRALRDAGQMGDAWTEYGRVVDDATKLSASESRYSQTVDAARAERAEVEPKLAFVTVTISHPPLIATLKVGGRPVPPDRWDAPIIAADGAVDVVLFDQSGKELARQTVLANVGQKTAVALDAESPSAPSPAPTSAAPNHEDRLDLPHAPEAMAPPEPSHLRTYAYVAGGVGIAALAGFATFGLMSHSDLNDLKASCPDGNCPPSKASEINNGSTFQSVANLCLGVGFVGVAAGATVFVLSLGAKSPGSAAPSAASASVIVAPGFIGVRGSL